MDRKRAVSLALGTLALHIITEKAAAASGEWKKSAVVRESKTRAAQNAIAEGKSPKGSAGRRAARRQKERADIEDVRNRERLRRERARASSSDSRSGSASPSASDLWLQHMMESRGNDIIREQFPSFADARESGGAGSNDGFTDYLQEQLHDQRVQDQAIRDSYD